MVKMMPGYFTYSGIKVSKESREMLQQYYASETEMIQDIMDLLDNKTENNTSVSSNL